VNHVVSIFPVSHRRACEFLEQLRSTQRLSPTAPPGFEQALRARLRELAKMRLRYGYRRLHVLLKREGFRVNHKRMQRLYRDEGLRVRVKKRKRARLGYSTNPSDRLSAACPNHVWALDFQFDKTSDARVLKSLNITGEFGKEAFAVEVERFMRGNDIVTIVERLINIHGGPEFVRMDNGTEMTSNTVADWCRFSASDISFIDPGSPWQNAYMESLNGKLREELLRLGIFTTLLEARIMAEDYRQNYKQNRPSSSLG
jgi:putative transposase